MERIELNTVYLSPVNLDGVEKRPGGTASLLPSGYKQVDAVYLTYNGSVNTGLKYGTDYDQVVFEMKRVGDFNGNGIIAETRGGGSSSEKNFGVYYGSGGEINRNNTWKYALVTTVAEGWVTMDCNGSKWKINDVEYDAATVASSKDVTTNILSDGNQPTLRVAMRQVVFLLDGVEVAHYVPCKEKSTGYFGFYDFVRGIKAVHQNFAEYE